MRPLSDPPSRPGSRPRRTRYGLLPEELETLFLDVGNTLITFDHATVAAELVELGHPCGADDVRRAEARARPALSDWLHEERRRTETPDTLRRYLTLVLERLEPPVRDLARPPADVLVERVTSGSLQLFGPPLPGVREALARAAQLGLQLVAVSNSDGRVVAQLTELGLADHLEHVVDSGVVGFEKPDPRLFAHALALSGADRRRTLHLGDLYAVDVLGARAAGIRGALVDPFQDWEGADCPRFRDLGELVDRLAAAATASAPLD